MTTETILADKEISKTLVDAGILSATQDVTAYDIAIASAIEQAVLQSEQVQAWKRDAERMEWYFGSADKTPWMPKYMRGCNEGWSVDQWRISIDAEMEKQK